MTFCPSSLLHFNSCTHLVVQPLVQRIYVLAVENDVAQRGDDCVGHFSFFQCRFFFAAADSSSSEFALFLQLLKS